MIDRYRYIIYKKLLYATDISLTLYLYISLYLYMYLYILVQYIGVKLYAVIISSSKAVTAALVDSVVDILSQAILAMADRYISR